MNFTINLTVLLFSSHLNTQNSRFIRIFAPRTEVFSSNLFFQTPSTKKVYVAANFVETEVQSLDIAKNMQAEGKDKKVRGIPLPTRLRFMSSHDFTLLNDNEHNDNINNNRKTTSPQQYIL